MSRYKIPVLPPARPRPTAIHAHACRHCPSAHFPPDPEARDILAWDKGQRAQTVFPCAWRPAKWCKGYCDLMGLQADDL